MLKLYYTGAYSTGSEQKEAALSLGGFMSSSTVSNNASGNLFEEFNIMSLKAEKSPIIGLILKNEGADLTNLQLWFDYQTPQFSKILIAFVTPIVSGAAVSLEKVQQYSVPYYVDQFYEANGVGNALSIGTFLANATLGIWLQKQYLIDIINTYYSDVELLNRYTNKVTPPTQDIPALKMSWT